MTGRFVTQILRVAGVGHGRSNARDLLLAALSGVLLVLTFPTAELWPVAFVALVPVLIALRGLGWRAAAGLGFVAGLVFFVGSLYWVVPTVVRYGGLSWVAATGVLLLLAGFLALYFAGFSAGVAVLRHRGVAFVLSTAALWVAFELLRSHLFTGFPWNLLGYSQYQNLTIIQIAALTGVYGVSFIVAGVNAAIADVLAARDGWRRAVGSLATAGLLAGGALAYGWAAPDRVAPPTIRVALLQGNFSQGIKWNAAFQDETMRVYRDLTLAQADFRPDLIVWPETAAPFFLRHDPLRSKVEGLAAKVGAPLLVGSPDWDGEQPHRYTNSAFLIIPEKGIAAKYDKVHLVPFGEYVPLKRILFFVNKLTQGAIGDFSPGTEFTVFSIPAGRFGVTISYEIYFPHEVRRYVMDGAEFLVNVTNDAWYGKSAAPYQHVAMVVFRAVENGRYLVRAANTGISAVVAPDGRIVASSGLFERTALTGMISAITEVTPYSRYGDLFGWATTSAVGIVLLSVGASRVIEGYQA
ncbi:MAG: apolipoprotein N-acyltransferase [Candidatus Binatia bacterium]